MKTVETFKIEGKEFGLFLIEKEMTSWQVVTDMDGNGYRPVTETELRVLGKSHPELGFPYPVVALGTVHRYSSERVVVGLDHCAGGDNIGHYYYCSRWGCEETGDWIIFAGVRK